LVEVDRQILNDIQNLPSNFWDFKSSDTRELSHGIHHYPAVMIYPISRNIIDIVSKYKKINSILDPFMGSGTILVEATVKGIKNIYGTDLNPLAKLMTEVKTTPLSNEKIKFLEHVVINEILKNNEIILNYATKFDNFIKQEKKLDISAKKNWGDNAHKYLEEYFGSEHEQESFPTFKNLGFWFVPKAIVCLQFLKKRILEITDAELRNFLLISFSETVRTVSNTRNGEFKLFRITVEQLNTYEPNTFETFKKVVCRNIEKIKAFSKICLQNESNVMINFDDTRSLETIADDSIDMVITSPPYGDSKTTVAYGQYSRLSLHWLDLENTNETNIIQLDNNLLGGKAYTNKLQWELLCSPTLVETLEKVSAKDPFRADEVFSFYLDLDKCIHAITKKMKKNTYQFWVVANRTVKLETMPTDIIICELAKKYGLEHLTSFNRNIHNKSMPSQNSPTNIVGQRVKTMTQESIIVLKKL